MATKLEKAIKREIELNGQLYMVTISPDGIKLTQKGFRKGREVTWQELLGGTAGSAGGGGTGGASGTGGAGGASGGGGTSAGGSAGGSMGGSAGGSMGGSMGSPTGASPRGTQMNSAGRGSIGGMHMNTGGPEMRNENQS
jgi:hypothetical protein